MTAPKLVFTARLVPAGSEKVPVGANHNRMMSARANVTRNWAVVEVVTMNVAPDWVTAVALPAVTPCAGELTATTVVAAATAAAPARAIFRNHPLVIIDPRDLRGAIITHTHTFTVGPPTGRTAGAERPTNDLQEGGSRAITEREHALNRC